jgi:hypothetical protein
MKKRTLSETEFGLLMPDALGDTRRDDDHETDWQAWSIGSGVACVVVGILTFINIEFANHIFKGYSAELAQNVNYFLIAMCVGFGLYCAYAIFKARSIQVKLAKNVRAR